MRASPPAGGGKGGRCYDFWEVGGKYTNRFPYANSEQLRGASTVVHVFSFSDRASLEGIPQDIGALLQSQTPVVLVGAKRDCFATCQASAEEAQAVAERCGVGLVIIDSPPRDETSGDGGESHQVSQLFQALASFK